MPPRPTPVVNKVTGDEYPSVKAAAEAMGVSVSKMNNHLQGMVAYVGGYEFAYKYPPRSWSRNRRS